MDIKKIDILRSDCYPEVKNLAREILNKLGKSQPTQAEKKNIIVLPNTATIISSK